MTFSLCEIHILSQFKFVICFFVLFDYTLIQDVHILESPP